MQAKIHWMRLATVLATDLTFIRPLSSCAPGPKELLATQHTHATQTGMCSAVCLHQSKHALRKVEDELQCEMHHRNARADNSQHQGESSAKLRLPPSSSLSTRRPKDPEGVLEMPRIRECVSHGCLRQHRHVAAGLTAYGSVKVPPHLFGSPRRSSSKSVRPRIHISGPSVHCITPNEPFFIGIL